MPGTQELRNSVLSLQYFPKSKTLLKLKKNYENSTFVYAKLLQSCPTLYSHVGCSPPGSSVHGISRQEYWSGLPWPSPGDLSNPGIELESLMSPTLAGRLFTTSTTWEAHEIIVLHAYSVPTTMVKLKPKAIFKLPCPLIHPPWYILQALWEKGNTKTRSSPDT